MGEKLPKCVEYVLKSCEFTNLISLKDINSEAVNQIKVFCNKHLKLFCYLMVDTVSVFIFLCFLQYLPWLARNEWYKQQFNLNFFVSIQQRALFTEVHTFTNIFTSFAPILIHLYILLYSFLYVNVTNAVQIWWINRKYAK